MSDHDSPSFASGGDVYPWKLGRSETFHSVEIGNPVTEAAFPSPPVLSHRPSLVALWGTALPWSYNLLPCLA